MKSLDRNNLHDYQKFSVSFIEEHPCAAILLDCGCGKTIITLTAITDLLFDSFDVHKVLVVCPLRVGMVWKNETQKWKHLLGLKLSVAIGTAAERKSALATPADITIINRENVEWLVASGSFDYDMVVIDELSSFKNAS